MVRQADTSKLIGKTIKDVIVVNRVERTPRCQIFLIFDDNTHFELYGDNILASRGVYEGGRNEILNYVRNSGAYVRAV